MFLDATLQKEKIHVLGGNVVEMFLLFKVWRAPVTTVLSYTFSKVLELKLTVSPYIYDVQKEGYMTFNVILAVSILLGINENPPIKENNKTSKKYKKLLLWKGYHILIYLYWP